MQHHLLFCIAVGLASTCASHASDNLPVAKSRIVSAGLFKNGLAVIRREITIPEVADGGDVAFLVLDLAEPVHGTFWIESDAPVTVRSTTVEQPAPAGPPTGNYQQDLAGQSVRIRLRERDDLIDGVVVAFPIADAAPRWDRHYAATNNYYYSGYADRGLAGQPAPRTLTLDTELGRVHLDATQIEAVIVSQGAATQATEPVEPGATQPVMPPGAPTSRVRALEFTIMPRGEPAGVENSSGRPLAQPSTIHISYLSKGLCWFPSYRVELTAGSRLMLRQQAVIRNELEDFQDAEINLITGYPNIAFANVDSPLAPRASIADFFRQLATATSPEGRLVNVMSQSSRNNRGVDDSGAVATPVGEGVDIHYQAVGKHSLRAGDSLAFDVAEASTDYQRIVEWIIPDTRDEWGRHIERSSSDDDRSKTSEDEPWDAMTFANPLPFPMTTAPAMILDGNRFAGQCASDWTSPGATVSLRVNRALSVHGSCGEQEEQSDRPLKHIGGREFREVSVKGEIVVANARNEAVNMVVRRRFSGTLQEAEGEPERTLREEGVYSINRRNELVWCITLQPGEERTLTYKYQVLAPH